MVGAILAKYPILSKYRLLTANTITATGNTTINGYWFAPNIIGTGTLISGTSPSGFNNTDSTNALTQLNSLITDITTHTSSLSIINISAGGNNTTFFPSFSYVGTNITFIDKTIKFDANNNSNAQFFITDTGSGMTFTRVTFVLLNGAKACNIYWLSNPTTGAGGITITNPVRCFPGIIITTSNNSTSSSTFTIDSKNIMGHIYSNTSTTITSTGVVEVKCKNTSN